MDAGDDDDVERGKLGPLALAGLKTGVRALRNSV